MQNYSIVVILYTYHKFKNVTCIVSAVIYVIAPLSATLHVSRASDEGGEVFHAPWPREHATHNQLLMSSLV